MCFLKTLKQKFFYTKGKHQHPKDTCFAFKKKKNKNIPQKPRLLVLLFLCRPQVETFQQRPRNLAAREPLERLKMARGVKTFGFFSGCLVVFECFWWFYSFLMVLNGILVFFFGAPSFHRFWWFFTKHIPFLGMKASTHPTEMEGPLEGLFVCFFSKQSNIIFFDRLLSVVHL